jgi:hypothetical protein
LCGAGVEINLGWAVEMPEDGLEVALVHASAHEEAVGGGECAESGSAEASARAAFEEAEYAGCRDFGGQVMGVEAEGERQLVVRDTDTGSAVALGERGDDVPHDRMHVHVLVAIDVGEGEPGGGEAVELSFNFAAELKAGAGVEKVAEAGFCGGGGEAAGRIDEVGDAGGRKQGAGVGDGDVEPDGEAWEGACEGDGVLPGVAGDHEAGAGQSGRLVRLAYGGIDGGIAAKVIGGE